MVTNKLTVNRFLFLFILFCNSSIKADNCFDYRDGASFFDWVQTEFGKQKEREAINQRVFGNFFIENWSASECDKKLAVALSLSFCRYEISDEKLGQKNLSVGEVVPVIGLGLNARYIPENFTIENIPYSDFQKEVTPFMYVYNESGRSEELKYIAVTHKKEQKEKYEGATNFTFVVYVNCNTGRTGLSTETGRMMPLKLLFFYHPMLNAEFLEINKNLEKRVKKSLWNNTKNNDNDK